MLCAGGALWIEEQQRQHYVDLGGAAPLRGLTGQPPCLGRTAAHPCLCTCLWVEGPIAAGIAAPAGWLQQHARQRGGWQ